MQELYDNEIVTLKGDAEDNCMTLELHQYQNVRDFIRFRDHDVDSMRVLLESLQEQIEGALGRMDSFDDEVTIQNEDKD